MRNNPLLFSSRTGNLQNKAGTVSNKHHKQVGKPESERIQVVNTYEPLIVQET